MLSITVGVGGAVRVLETLSVGDAVDVPETMGIREAVGVPETIGVGDTVGVREIVVRIGEGVDAGRGRQAAVLSISNIASPRRRVQ